MKVIYNENHRAHYPKKFLVSGNEQDNPETPERADIFFEAAEKEGLEFVTPDDYGLGPVAAVHAPVYLDFLQNIYDEWQKAAGSDADVLPNIQPDHRRGSNYPSSPTGKAGYHQLDLACPIGKHTWKAALASANSAVHAAQLILDGEKEAYALCRPPGHHAGRDRINGFCYLNNAAIAAQHLQLQYPRIALIDIDLHHGNGTQDIFYERPDVFFVSLHADPREFYPHYWGYADEQGAGLGFGYNANIPLPKGTDNDTYLEQLKGALDRIRLFMPNVLVVSLGLDIAKDDPLSFFNVTKTGFGKIGREIAMMDMPVLLVQEGGYVSENLGDYLGRFLDGFMKARESRTSA